MFQKYLHTNILIKNVVVMELSILIVYSDCVLLIPMGPFPAGYKCDISIDSAIHGDFCMYIDCDGYEGCGELFVPMWTYIKNINNSEQDKINQ